jgi:hypothetical protein
MKTYEIKRALFGGRAYKTVQYIHAINVNQAITRFTDQTIRPHHGHYAAFFQGEMKKKFEVK